MESHSKEKRSKAINYIALGSLLAFCSTMTGCTSNTSIAQRDQQKDKDKDKEETPASGAHYYGGTGSRIGARPLSSNYTSKPVSAPVSRGWFGGFRFSGG